MRDLRDLEADLGKRAKVVELYRRFVAGDRNAFVGAELAGCDLARLELRLASFVGADLTRADFSGADLSYAGFDGARLHGAIFRDAALHWADLGEADGAKLSGAKRGTRDATIAGYRLTADHPDGWHRLEVSS